MSDELRDEYDFDYRQAKPNRFANGVKAGGRLVALDPEVAAAFPGSAEVNAALKVLLKAAGVAVPRLPQDPAARGSRALFDAALSQVPDVEPEEHDRLPPKGI